MSTFDISKTSLKELLADITSGRLQLPDFQRGWVWDDEHIRSLLVSVARAFPVGAVMLLETGGAAKFHTKEVQGVVLPENTPPPERLILDGQQRLTSLTQAIALKDPVGTRTSKGRKIKRHYYLHIGTCLEGDDRIEDALLGVDENRQIRSNFAKDVDLDLSSVESECQQMHFPLSRIFDWAEWLQVLHRVNPTGVSEFLRFQKEVISKFDDYHVPVIVLKKSISKEAVCLVFEKVNTGGVALSVFELMTAIFAADNYRLRDDWYGTKGDERSSRQKRLASDPLLGSVEATSFLQAVTLLHTLERKQGDVAAGKTGKQIRPVSAKRSAVLELKLDAYEHWKDQVEAGFMQAGHFLRKQCFYAEREIPYSTQLVPLAAIMTLLKDRWHEPRIYQKLSQWFWCGVLGELYGGAVETRVANDLDELMQWFEDDNAVPRTITDASFQPERLDSLRTRLSAAYKAINVLVLREGARDFFWNDTIQRLDGQDIELDIHHIFPKKWCKEKGLSVKNYDNIINKTPISAKTNRMIGGDAPSIYLAKIQQNANAQYGDAEMDQILESHGISPETMRQDDFDGFQRSRRQSLLYLIEGAMGKPLIQALPDSDVLPV